MHLLKFRKITSEPSVKSMDGGFQMSIKLGGAAHGFGLIHMFELVEAAG